jgi:hypothetical protein
VSRHDSSKHGGGTDGEKSQIATEDLRQIARCGKLTVCSRHTWYAVLEQFVWPPQDPERYPMRRLPYSSSASAFTYGNGDLNPALRPSSSLSTNLRARKHSAETRDDLHGTSAGPLPPQLSGRPGAEEGYSSGEERDEEDKAWRDTDDEASRRSSPEPYLSDYDDEDDVDVEGGPARHRRVRVRRGSEGYEIAPTRRWDAELEPPARLDDDDDRTEMQANTAGYPDQET